MFDQEEIHRKCFSNDPGERREALNELKLSFSLLPDQQRAWEDLHRLTRDANGNVRELAADAIGTIFQHIPDKEQAWKELILLTVEGNYGVRVRAAGALGYVFQHAADKTQAWEDILLLTRNAESEVRVNANHSLGIASVFNASRAKSDADYRKELENAITYFEKASRESSWYEPPKFCLPFYRSFYTIISTGRHQAKDEVEIYLADAKNAIEGSKNKRLLFEAVETLAKALKEAQDLEKEVHNLEKGVQDLENTDLENGENELGFYRAYCEHVEELLSYAGETASTTATVIRKGLPILDKKLKTLLKAPREKTKTQGQKSKRSSREKIACAVSKEIQKWEIGSQEEMTRKIEDVTYLLKKKVADLPENEYVLNKIEAMKHERDLTKQYETLLFVIGQIRP